MPHFIPSVFLRRALMLDAVTSGASGLLMLLGGGLLQGLSQIPIGLMQGAGLFLLPYAAFVAFEGTRANTSRISVFAIIAVNAVWAAASLALLVAGLISPTWLGIGFVAAQACVVALFAELQY